VGKWRPLPPSVNERDTAVEVKLQQSLMFLLSRAQCGCRKMVRRSSGSSFGVAGTHLPFAQHNVCLDPDISSKNSRLLHQGHVQMLPLEFRERALMIKAAFPYVSASEVVEPGAPSHCNACRWF
jgi:hypothetical protein